MAFQPPQIDQKKFAFMLLATVAVTCIYLLVQKLVIDDPGILTGKGTKHEVLWIEESDPVSEAKHCFVRGDYKFIEIYLPSNSKDAPAGKWVAPGMDAIPQSFLKANPKRMRIHATCNWGMTPEQQLFSEKARKFAGKFNMTMAECHTTK